MGRIIGEDIEWITIQCWECDGVLKVQKSLFKWQMGCPYCSHLIELRPYPKFQETEQIG